MSVTLRVSGSRPLRMKPEKQTATRGQVLTHSAREALDGTQRHAGIFVNCGGRNPRLPNRVGCWPGTPGGRDTRWISVERGACRNQSFNVLVI